MHRETIDWDELTQRFNIKFTFEDESSLVDAALQAIRTRFFSEEGSMDVVPLCNVHRTSMIVHEILKFYHVGQ
jgi:hypothetical protein